MNSPDIPYQVYSKRKMLYALHLARKTKRKNMILCEGNLDVVTLHQAGFDNAVASMGTALTAEQTKLLSRFTKELVLCYDNDAAGRTATEKALKLLENSELKVRVLQLPNQIQDGKPVKQDPDDFIKIYGSDAFEKLLSGSEAGIEFRMNQIAAKYDLSNDENKISYGGEISRLIAGLDNPIQREIYINRAAEIGGIDAETIAYNVRLFLSRRNPFEMAVKEARKTIELEKNEETRNYSKNKEIKTTEKSQTTSKNGYHKRGGIFEEGEASYQQMNPSALMQRNFGYRNINSARAEEGIITFLLLYPELFSGYKPLRASDFSDSFLGKVFSLLWAAKEENRALSPSVLEGTLTPEEMSRVSGFSKNLEIPRDKERALADYINIIRRESEKRTNSGNADFDVLAATTKKYKNKKK